MFFCSLFLEIITRNNCYPVGNTWGSNHQCQPPAGGLWKCQDCEEWQLLTLCKLQLWTKAFTESQHGWGGKVCLEMICSNFPTQESTPRAGCPAAHPGGFWRCLRKEILQTLCAVCASAQPSAEQRWNLLCSKCVWFFSPTVFCPVSRQHWKEPDSDLFALSLEAFLDIDKMPLTLLCYRLNRTSSPSLSPQKWCLSPLFSLFYTGAVKYIQAEIVLFPLNRVNSSESTLGPQANWLLLTLKLVRDAPGLLTFLLKFLPPCPVSYLPLFSFLDRSAGEVQGHFPAQGWKKLPHLLSDHVQQEARANW